MELVLRSVADRSRRAATARTSLLNRAILLLTLLVGAAPPAGAVDLFVSGEQAAALCRDTPDWCLGFVTGALDGWAALEHYYPGDKFCAPPAASAGGLAEIFRHELQAHPEKLGQPAAYLLYERLIAEYPCP